MQVAQIGREQLPGWLERVAKTSPARALEFVLRAAEILTPRQLRLDADISSTRSPLPFVNPILPTMDAEEATRAYLRMIHGDEENQQ